MKHRTIWMGWVTAILTLPAAGVSAGQLEYTWLPTGPGNWSTAANWQPAGLPGTNDPGDTAVIGEAPGIGGTAIVDSSVPQLNRWFLGGVADGAVGNLEVRTGGTLRTTSVSANSIGLNGRGLLTVSGGLVSMAGRLDINNGRVVQTGGRVEATDATRGDLFLGFDALAEYELSAGTLDVASSMFLGFSHQSLFRQSGGSLRVGQDLRIGNTAGSSELRLSGGNVLIVDELVVGSISSPGRATIATSTSTLRAASLIVEHGSVLEFEIDTRVTPVQIPKPATLNGNLEVEFVGVPMVGTIIPLLTVGGTLSSTSRFDGRPEGAIFTATRPSGVVQVRLSYAANVDGGSVANDVALQVISPILVGDANQNGIVERGDLAIVAANLSAIGGVNVASGDINGDGRVSIRDLQLVQAHYGETLADIGLGGSSPVAVPEGSTLGLLMAGAAMLLAARKARSLRAA